MKVAPKLNLKATLSSIADRKSMLWTYRCSFLVGTILIPRLAANYTPKLADWFPGTETIFDETLTCTPKTSRPIKNARDFENVDTARPPTNPNITRRVSLLNTEYYFALVLKRCLKAIPGDLTQRLKLGPFTSIHLSSKTRIPNILPELICRNAFGLTLPPFTIGTFASRV